jgi:uncharacterized BrkB/YihY/UPF0761 family membrane protein
MSVPDIKPTEPGGAQRKGCMSAILAVIGMLMLLPGACVLITALIALPGVLVQVWQGGFDKVPWLILGMWAAFWLICLLISYAGLRLLKRDLR